MQRLAMPSLPRCSAGIQAGCSRRRLFHHQIGWGLLELDPNATDALSAEVYEGAVVHSYGGITDFVNETKPIVRVRTRNGFDQNGREIKSFSPLNDQSALVRLVLKNTHS